MAACVYPIYLPKREIEVPCNNCAYCLQNRKTEWLFRISNEQQYSDSTYFVTLTYADEYVPIQYGTGVEILDKSDLQNFLKRLRYYHSLHSKSQIRYYAVGEYGTEFLRPHYHLILFNAVLSDVEKSWPLGFVQCEPPYMGAVGYVVGYVSSTDNLSVSRGVPKQFSVMSLKPALGYRYLQSHGDWHKNGMRNYTKIRGQTGRLPRYYKRKLFTQDQQKVISEKSVLAYELQYLSWLDHYRSLSYPNPAEAVKEMYYASEKQLMEKINERKKHV